MSLRLIIKNVVIKLKNEKFINNLDTGVLLLLKLFNIIILELKSCCVLNYLYMESRQG